MEDDSVSDGFEVAKRVLRHYPVGRDDGVDVSVLFWVERRGKKGLRYRPSTGSQNVLAETPNTIR